MPADRVRELVVTIQTSSPGDPRANHATAALIEAFNDYVRSPHARRRIIDHDELQSIAYESIWRAAQSFDLTRDAATFGTWAFTLTRRRVIDHLRKEQRRPRSTFQLADHDQAQDGRDHAAELAAKEQAARLRSLLSPREQQVFDRRREGHSFNEIALALACSRKAVDNASQRIRRKSAEVMTIG